MRDRGVHVERHVERLRPLENRPEPLVVEKQPVGQPVYQRALEAELGNRALQLVGRRLRIGSGDCGESGEPVGMRADRFVEPVIGAARQPDGGLGIQLLQSRIGMRQHLQIDAGLVHFPQPQLADIVETLDDPRRIGRVQPGDMPLHLRVEVMLLQRDDVGFRRPFAPPPMSSIGIRQRRRLDSRIGDAALSGRQPAGVGPQIVTFVGGLFRRQSGVAGQQPARHDMVGCPVDRFDADQPPAAEAEYREIAGRPGRRG